MAEKAAHIHLPIFVAIQRLAEKWLHTLEARGAVGSLTPKPRQLSPTLALVNVFILETGKQERNVQIYIRPMREKRNRKYDIKRIYGKYR